MAEEGAPSKKSRTTTIYMYEEDRILFARLEEQTGLNRSALVRHLIHKAALGDDPELHQKLREHVTALSKLLL